ncbi:Predicted 5' DNA nuclease, flap endonuclease-1-like, helix-3-turn-helix (H3TH) domain [Zobellia uliginosa]|uniref:Predicted 5' DNA nuclease, flap endonuclease-1-like, helix-3-turn-helix (H3TH) domain n=1 Tax=Zobellia uliginosa TaxID=143224 RepID=A0ABY1KIT7_9FLAO|nr:hypothetical protein [Zobellia uliginosa]SIS39681.1 Predicted 5' DNA nuclease, flap endonuclease-1-like, helix-3-turn-helix (H3TH) domain [Zobellia uliginosa]
MESGNINMMCWLIPLLVGVICGILGYLLGKSNTKVIDNSDELKRCNDDNSRLRAQLEACKQQLITMPETKEVSSSLGATPMAAVPILVPFDAAAAKAAIGKTVKENDLKVVEGIGPKIEGLFHAEGIKTWKDLSETSVARCQEVLKGGGDRYKIHDPASWPMQAKMCYEGKWTELARWQDEHDHGKL